MGATLATSHFQTLLALAEARTGRYEEAWRSIDEAISFVDESGERYYGGYASDTAGRIALMQPDPDAAMAEDYFRRAIEICRECGQRGSELRPTLHLAQLWRDQGKSREAYDLLAPVYNWFTEGFDRPELKEAKALLDELKNELQ
jgi:predicted ATPase